MVEGTQDNKQIVAHLEQTIEKSMAKIADEKASKSDVAELNKQILALKATLASMGEDAERETKKYNKKHVMTARLEKMWANELLKSFDAAGLWAKLGANEDVRKSYISKATNVSEYESTGGQGMLQTSVDSVINAIVPIYGVGRRNCRVITGVRGSINLNSRSALPSFGRTVNVTVRDDATITPNSPTFSKINIQPAQSAGIAKITNKLIYDSVPNVLQDTIEQLGESAGLAEDTELFLGDGSATYNSFTGLKTATIGYNNQVVGVRTGSFNNFDALLQCQQNVHPAVARSGNNKYHMTPQTFAYLQQTKASTSGTYFYDLTVNEWKVAGHSVEFNQVMDNPDSNNTSFAIGKVPVIFGDLKKAVVLGIGRDMELRTLFELYQATSETGIKLEYDFAYGIVLPEAVTRVVVRS